MKKTLTLVFVAATFLFLGTASADEFYKTKVTGGLEVGKAGTVTLEVLPGKGFKWNKDYPAKLTLENGKHVELAQTTYKKVKGDIVGTDESGKVAIKGTGKTAGADTLKGTLSFSVCSLETCKLLKEDVSIAVEVK